jgi:hypothetical protein
MGEEYVPEREAINSIGPMLPGDCAVEAPGDVDRGDSEESLLTEGCLRNNNLPVNTQKPFSSERCCDDDPHHPPKRINKKQLLL